MTDRDRRVTDEEARELWRRAAELHAAAERARSSPQALAPMRGPGLTLEDVSAAAEGAGIDPDYVRLALAERRLPDAEEVRRDRWTARWLRRLVGDVDAIEVSRSIRAAPERVLEAFRGVAEHPPYGLRLEDGVGEDPLRDGVLVYRRAAQAVSGFDGTMEMADVRVVLVMVRAEDEGARVRLRVPLFHRGLNLALTGVSAGVLGAGASWGGWSLGGALAGVLGLASAAALVVPAGLGAAAGGALGVAGFRRVYNGVVRKAEAVLEGLLGAVALEAEGRAPGVLRALEQTGRAERRPEPPRVEHGE